MSKDMFVYSSLSSDNVYTATRKGGADLPTITHRVLVKGGANVADPKRIVTPRGVATRVTAEEAEILRNNEIFQMHEKNGFVTLAPEEVDPEQVVASGMEARDPSAPLVPEDYEAEGKTAPQTESVDAPAAPRGKKR